MFRARVYFFTRFIGDEEEVNDFPADPPFSDTTIDKNSRILLKDFLLSTHTIGSSQANMRDNASVQILSVQAFDSMMTAIPIVELGVTD